MARSLGMTAYRALTRRGVVQNDAPEADRPKGELVWIHAGEPENLLAVQDLALRLIGIRQNLHAIITYPQEESSGPRAPARPDQGLLQIAVPGEHPTEVAAFLDHWRPDACIWVWGGLRPNLVIETAQRGCPLVLIDAGSGGFDGRRNRWMPDLTRQMLLKFLAVFTKDAAGAKKLGQFGLPGDIITQTGPLLAGGQVLGFNEQDMNELSAALAGRPVWFAAGLTQEEIPIVLAAHKHALRLFHRLLLVVQPDDPDCIPDLITQAADRNLPAVLWDDGQFPDDTTQLLISGEARERGLFYRVAPVSFLGGTLISGGNGCDPLEAAALGSAILYGPRLRHFMPSYSRLASAGAARIVNDADALGTAVSRLIAPDQAASMAHAGWDVISQGAMLTDQVIDFVQDTLDTKLVRT
ncbi:3-deoxy-D-manno-octulosonic acid transferase [Sulfitobacter sp. F26204]|uniref:3-deoxy-D-manno-octulosonic acid transferase n=1 Tax=Sulfitobacter sp. F26204 TaxID=2996014 RepID=UPI00225E242B|nr:glycosyltransferase N-terminal domain-containing protein [Sulfitobacter sp. F26204]MCX7558030.1 3-deoxy-D-manno-octulosonic acid transferase [Sulfitobacter sp. F26204]